MKNVFEKTTSEDLKARLDRLTAETQPVWGTMDAGQMLAHCSVPYESLFDPEYAEKHPKPNAFVRGLLRLLVKKIVVGEKPYKRNSRTAPEFIMKGDKDFDAEKARLVGYIDRTQELGAAHFEGKDSHSFGPLTEGEWSNLFYKHLDHHLAQFGA